MQNYLGNKIKLFEGIRDDDISSILSCLGAKTQKYTRHEAIINEGDRIDYIGLVMAGTVLVKKKDHAGNSMNVNYIRPHNLIAETFVCAGITKSPVTIIADDDCEVYWIQFRRVVTTCSSACVFHAKLIENMMRLLAENILESENKLEILSKRSIREKLTAYLIEQSKRASSSEFSIALDRRSLADYLAVDRSALSRELCKMRDEGMIWFNKNSFSIFNINSNEQEVKRL